MRTRTAEYVGNSVTINVCIILFGKFKGRECLENTYEGGDNIQTNFKDI
jgi:hypothetical protein